MYCRAIEAEVDSEGYGRPCWVLSPTVETYLHKRTVSGQSKLVERRYTLFADFPFNFSKIFCDWALLAEAMMCCRRTVGSGGMKSEIRYGSVKFTIDESARRKEKPVRLLSHS